MGPGHDAHALQPTVQKRRFAPLSAGARAPSLGVIACGTLDSPRSASLSGCFWSWPRFWASLSMRPGPVLSQVVPTYFPLRSLFPGRSFPLRTSSIPAGSRAGRVPTLGFGSLRCYFRPSRSMPLGGAFTVPPHFVRIAGIQCDDAQPAVAPASLQRASYASVSR